MEEPPVSVIYKGIRYKRNPDAKQRAHRVYYVAPRGSGLGSLHREIWRDNHPGEEIPPGWHIHHDDHDPFNNDPANLVLASPAGHAREHPEEMAGVGAERLAEIRPLAAAWHSSPEGIAWHREHGKRTWDDRDRQHAKTCPECGQEFESYFDRAGQVGYCSRRCINRARERKYLETVTCPVCGGEFQRDRYKKRPITCSRACGQEHRRRAS